MTTDSAVLPVAVPADTSTDFRQIASKAFAMAALVWRTESFPDAKNVIVRRLSLGTSFSCEIVLDGITVRGIVQKIDGHKAEVRITQVSTREGAVRYPNSWHSYEDVPSDYEKMRRGGR